jgi:hypothetical protein
MAKNIFMVRECPPRLKISPKINPFSQFFVYSRFLNETAGAPLFQSVKEGAGENLFGSFKELNGYKKSIGVILSKSGIRTKKKMTFPEKFICRVKFPVVPSRPARICFQSIG